MAALSKFADLAGFRERLVLHSGLPTTSAVGIAFALPALELTCGFCLVLGIARREAALLTALLLGAFLVYTISRGVAPDCGCFLFPAALPWPAASWTAPLRDVLLLLVSAGLAWRRDPPPQAQPILPGA